MRSTLVIIGLILFVNCAAAQRKETDAILVFDFSPAFLEKSTLTFHKATRKPFVELTVFDKARTQKVRHKEKLNLQSDDLDKLLAFFDDYRFRVKGSEDTIGIEKYVKKGGDTIVSYVVTEGLDGVTVNGALTQGTRVRKFAFWSPQEGTDNYKLMYKVFAILNSNLKEQESITYIKALQRYFTGRQ